MTAAAAITATVPRALAERAQGAPHALALAVDGQRATWGELHAAARDAAAVLARAAGAKPGERVGILMPNSVAWATWAYGAMMAGCPVVPLNTRLRGSELAFQLRHSAAAAVVAAGAHARERLDEVLLEVEGGFESLPALRTAFALDGNPTWATSTASGPAELPDAEPDDVALIQYTSGTTAFPKGVMLTHRQVLTNARGVAARMHLTSEDRLCSPSPFFHVGGSTLLLLLSLVSGAPAISFRTFDPGEVLDTIEREQVTVYNGVETFFLGLLKHPRFAPERVASVRAGWIAASAELVDQVHRAMGMTGIANVYGISEASPNVTIADVDEPLAVRRTCGTPHSGMEVRVVDFDTREPVGPGVSGLIEARGPCVMKGYLDDPQQTAATIDADGWLTTGDRGYLDDAGNLVYEGRAKDMLRVGGENVAPAEIEAVLLGHPDLASAAVVGVPHDRLVEVPAAVVVPHPDRNPDPETISAYVAERLAKFKVPRIVLVLDELPMTGSGKVQKFALAELAREHLAAR